MRRKKKMTAREREIENHRQHVREAEQMMLRKTAELRISDLKRQKSDVEQERRLTLERKVSESKGVIRGEALSGEQKAEKESFLQAQKEAERQAQVETGEQAQLEAEESARKEWMPGSGKELRYGAYVITSDQAEQIHSLKTELTRPQKIKHTTTDERSVEIQWLGLEKEPLSPHSAVRCVELSRAGVAYVALVLLYE
jgi:hypothetical protein